MSTNNDYKIDPELKEDLENTGLEEILVEYGTQGKGDNDRKTEFAEKWFPDAHEWQGKTKITFKQARFLALARHMGEMFEELKPLQNAITNVIQDYEMYLTSVEGLSREQQAGVLRSMFGGPSQDVEEARSTAMQMLAGSMNQEENE